MGHGFGDQDGVFRFLGLKVGSRLSGLRRICY